MAMGGGQLHSSDLTTADTTKKGGAKQGLAISPSQPLGSGPMGSETITAKTIFSLEDELLSEEETSISSIYLYICISIYLSIYCL